jgi:AcrR family transcriptional regulator
MDEHSPTLVLPALQSRSRAQVQRIIDAGLELVKERNFADVTMDQIAERAGCSVGTLYKRFTNKDALLEVLTVNAREEIVTGAGIGTSPRPFAASTLDELIRQIIGFLVANMQKHEGLLRALMVHQVLKPGANRILQNTSALVADTLVDAAREFRPEALDPVQFERELRVVYQMAVGTLINIIINAPGPMQLQDDDLADTIANTIIRGLPTA